MKVICDGFIKTVACIFMMMQGLVAVRGASNPVRAAIVKTFEQLIEDAGAPVLGMKAEMFVADGTSYRVDCNKKRFDALMHMLFLLFFLELFNF